MNSVVELVRFRVAPEAEAAFVAQRPRVDAALARFAGFLGSELLKGPDRSWTVLVRWASRADVLAAQAVTLATPGLPELSAWTGLASEFVSFETAELRVPEAALEVGLRFAREGLGQARMAAFDELLSPDIVVTTALSPQGPIRGLEAYKQVFAGFADAWPLIDFSIDDSFAAGERVVVCFTATAVFRKDYYGVKANGVIAPLKEMHMYTVRGGRIVENVVGAINLPFEFTMFDALHQPVLGGLKFDAG